MSEIKEGYSPIKTAFGDDEGVTKDEISLEPEAIVDPVIEEPQDEAPVVEAKEEVKKEVKEEAVKPKASKKRKGRATQRIKQLVTKNNNMAEELAAARQANAELQAQILAGNKTAKTGMKETLEANISSLTKQLTSAMQDGETEEAVALQDKLMDTKMQLAGVSSELKHIESQPEPAAAAPVEQEQEVSEKALDWVDAHPSFKTDQMFYTMSMVLNNTLIQEGFDPNSDDFYEELDTRLSKRFPEEFGVEGKDEVNLEEDTTDSSPADSEDVKKESTKARTTEQTVSGSSRISADTIQPRKKVQQVTLSQADLAQAERFGIPLDRMSKRKAHIENNEGSNGYVPIMIPTK